MQVPPGDGSLQPEAVEAIVEVTKRSKPSAMVTFGDLAILQAGTRVNAEQASKMEMRKPTVLMLREGRCRWARE